MTPLQAALVRAQERDFGHVDHIRLGWQLLDETNEHAADLARVREALRAVSVQRHGDTSAYHETITGAFMHLVQAARSALPASHSFETFCLMYPEILRSDALELYYSAEALVSVEARAGWIDPDLRDLPRGIR